MANKFYQSLHIESNNETIQEILMQLIEDEKMVRFSNLFPIPSEKELIKLKMTNSDWCSQEFGNGTDFGILSDIVEIREDSAVIPFMTNWSPVRQFTLKLSEVYLDITFSLSFSEPINGIQGFVECRNGEVLKNEWHVTERPHSVRYVVKCCESHDISSQEINITCPGDSVDEIIALLTKIDNELSSNDNTPFPGPNILQLINLTEKQWYARFYDSPVHLQMEKQVPFKQLVYQISHIYPDIFFCFKFSDPNSDYQGTFVCENGEVRVDEWKANKPKIMYSYTNDIDVINSSGMNEIEYLDSLIDYHDNPENT